MSQKLRKQREATRSLIASQLRRLETSVSEDFISADAQAECVGIIRMLSTQIKKVEVLDQQILDGVSNQNLDSELADIYSITPEYQQQLATLEAKLKMKVSSSSGSSPNDQIPRSHGAVATQ